MISRAAIREARILLGNREAESIKIHGCDENGNERSLPEAGNATLMETYPTWSRRTLLLRCIPPLWFIIHFRVNHSFPAGYWILRWNILADLKLSLSHGTTFLTRTRDFDLSTDFLPKETNVALCNYREHRSQNGFAIGGNLQSSFKPFSL